MPAVPAPLEVEAKLAVTSEHDLRAIAGAGQLGPYALRPRGVARLHSVYFDTADLVLARHAMALRARRHGRRWEVTLKWAGQVSGAVHSRPELTEPLSRPPGSAGLVLSPAFQQQISALVAGRRLQPVLVSDVRRELVDIHAAIPGTTDEVLVELALDKVDLHAPNDGSGEARETYREIEVEQKGGARADVDQLARLLQKQFGLTPSTDTKFSHGINLLYGPELSEFDAPLADGSLRRAAQRLVGRHLAGLRQYDPGTRVGEDPEALHDMRVASRRLRALLRFLGGAFEPRRAERLRSELRWLNELLSPVRDCDVQMETLRRYEAALPAARRIALGPYHDYIRHRREQHRRAMLVGLGSKRYFTLLLKLEQFAHDRRPVRLKSAAAPAAEVGREAMKRAFRHLLREGGEAATTPTPEELHHVRIRAKRLRYLLEFFRESSGKPGRRLLRDLVRLQDLLGAHNDAMVAATFLDGYVNGPGADSKASTLMTLGGFLQDELRRGRKARARFHQTWKGFAAKRTIMDWKAVQRILKKEAALVAARQPRRSTTTARRTK
jgi:triphosphatase